HKLISQMSPGALRTAYILYIGAGAVATGGFIALARAIPTIISAFRGGLKDLQAGAAATAAKKRTERALPMSLVLGGSLTSAIAIGFVLLMLDQAHTTYRPEVIPDVNLSKLVDPDGKKATAPDGKEYRIAYVQEDVGKLERGRYLVDDDGSVAYTMVASVD